MLKNIFNKIYNFSVEELSGIFATILGVLARSQLSNNSIVRLVGFLPFSLLTAILGDRAYKLIAYAESAQRREKKKLKSKDKRLISYLFLALSRNGSDSVSSINAGSFKAMLKKDELDYEVQFNLGHKLFNAGKLPLAKIAFEELNERSSGTRSISDRLILLRDCGITSFMLGDIQSANYYWSLSGAFKKLGRISSHSGAIYQVLGESWLAAIGHVAMIDFYIKYHKLYHPTGSRIVLHYNFNSIKFGKDLIAKFIEKGLIVLEPGELKEDYNSWAKRNGAISFDELNIEQNLFLGQEFWDYEFPDGQILGYTHATSKIQKEWESQNKAPLLKLDDSEKESIKQALALLGIPADAWYVCLHVREPGFHKDWNTLYPSMRDANIKDYFAAIEHITSRGGWVIRMGDSSMSRLPKMKNVVDYAHSNLKFPKLDILLTLGCKFFFGTNSGFATIPSIYGVRCIFSNWVPIGLPLWSSNDLVFPKVFYDTQNKKIMSMDETFNSGLAFIQNSADIPEYIKVVENTSEDLLLLAKEALGEISLPYEEIKNAEMQYIDIAYRNHSYVGSKLAKSFIKKYQMVFNIH
jgi:putative glycosyltransferase (TIGR04372 family)